MILIFLILSLYLLNVLPARFWAGIPKPPTRHRQLWESAPWCEKGTAALSLWSFIFTVAVIIRSTLEPLHHPPGARHRWLRRTVGCTRKSPDWPPLQASRIASKAKTDGRS